MRVLIGAVVTTLALASPVLGSTRAQRVAAAKTFAARTHRLAQALAAHESQGDAARESRRLAAGRCASVFEASPEASREALRDVYFWYLSGGLWAIDAKLYGSWIADLRRSRRIDRAPALARAADALRQDYRNADFVYRAFPDVCATVAAWRDAGWSAAADPVAALRPPAFDEGRHDRVIAEATRQIRRYAGAQLSLGIDEVDARVHATRGCDAIGKLLFPDDYRC